MLTPSPPRLPRENFRQEEKSSTSPRWMHSLTVFTTAITSRITSAVELLQQWKKLWSPWETTRRWVHVLFLGVIGAIVTLLLTPAVRLIADTPYVTSYKPYVWPLLLALSLGSLVTIFRQGWNVPAYLGLKYLPLYPPTWFAVVPGLWILYWLERQASLAKFDAAAPEIPEALGWISLVAALAIVLGPILARFIQLAECWLTRNEHSTPRSPAVSMPLSPDALESWLLDDSPVSAAADDRFGFDPIAQRIVNRWHAMENQEEAPSIAVIGPLGSGKSSLLALCRSKLRPPHRIRLVSLGLWSYRTAEAAIEGCLDALVSALGKEANAPAVSGLHTDYIAAIESTAGSWGSLAGMTRRPDSPEEVLERFERVACALGLRFVLWVEDIERLGTPNLGAGAAQLDRERELVRALLSLLDRRKNISVVIASTGYALRDLDKLVRYTERIPRLMPTAIGRVLGTFRDQCLALPPDMIDPNAASEDRLSRLLRPSPVALGTHLSSPPDALVTLYSTPRQLKASLRSCLDIWRALAGEIDPDDLLCMSSIRHFNYGLFEGIDTRFDALRRECRNGELAWPAPTAYELEETHRSAVQTLLRFVFESEKPQGLSRTHPVDYWRRFLASGRDQKHSDQERLRQIHEALKDPSDHTLAALLQQEDVYNESCHLWPKQSIDKTRALHVLELLIRDWMSHAYRHDNTEPPLVGITALLEAIPPASLQTELTDLLRHNLTRLVPEFPLLARALEENFCFSENKPRLLDDVSARGIRVAIEKALGRLADLPPAELADWLTRLDTTGLHHLVWGPARIRSKEADGVPFSDWPRFSSQLLKTAKHAPDIALPHLARLVTNVIRTSSDDEVSLFVPARADTLFGAGKLLRLFHDRPIHCTDGTYLAVRNAAAEAFEAPPVEG